MPLAKDSKVANSTNKDGADLEVEFNQDEDTKPAEESMTEQAQYQDEEVVIAINW